MSYPRTCSICLWLLIPTLCAEAASAAPPDRAELAIRLELTADADIPRDEHARLAMVTADGTAVLCVDFSRDAVRVFEGEDRQTQPLFEQAAGLEAGTHTVVVRRKANRLDLCLDGKRLARLPVALDGDVSAVFQPSPHFRAARDRVRPQRIEPVSYTDGFERGQGEGGLWETVSGRFVLNTSLNPGSSQSAFQLWSSAPDGTGVAVASNSYWFWDDYEAGVSVQAAGLPACLGLVFHYLDAGSYHVLRWSQKPGEPGTIEFVRRRPEGDHVLATAAVAMAPDQWHRLTVQTFDGRAWAFVNGVEVLRTEDACFTGGQIGLFIERTSGVYFDDVTVRSIDGAAVALGQALDRPFGPSEKAWTDFSGKLFLNDPHMIQWSHPRSFWQDGPSGMIAWFRTRFYQDVRFVWERGETPAQWPAKPIEIVLFGEQDVRESGYRVVVSGDRVKLSRQGQAVTDVPFLAETLDSLNVDVAREGVSVTANGVRLIEWSDPEPLREGKVGAVLGVTGGSDIRRPDWRDTTRLESSHRLDYSFDGAPTAWEVASGTWRGTHRWACVPRWSFFGGRGGQGAAGTEFGNAMLWHRRLFEGDFDMELFLAPMEGTAQRVHFAWPATVSVAFAADGRDMDSGYMLLFGGYDLPSRLYRNGHRVAEWPDRVDPSLRRRPMPLYHRVTQTWQHIRIQRRGGQIAVDFGKHDDEGQYLGLERAFEWDDPDPLSGDRFGLWTWGANGVAVARAIVSYANSPGVAALDTTAKGKRVGDVTVTEVSGAGGEPAEYRRITNASAGGTFAYDLLDKPVDIGKTGTLDLDLRLNDGLALSLIADIRGQPVEVVVCGPERYRVTTVPLGRLTPEAETPWARWQHCSFDLTKSLRAVFPDGPLVIDRVTLASPYETFAEVAGLGVNHAGAFYDIAGVSWRESPTTAVPATAGALEVRVEGVRPVEDFEADTGECETIGLSDGAVLYRDRHEPCKGEFSLRMLNQVVGGPAGAWLTRAPFNLSAFPRIALDCRVPADMELNLIVEANGERFEVGMSGTDASWPVIGTMEGFAADGAWHRAEFALYDALRKHLETPCVEVTGIALADSKRMSTPQGVACWVDNVTRVSAVDPAKPTSFVLSWPPHKTLEGYSHVVDNKPDTVPATVLTGQGDTLLLQGELPGHFLHLRAKSVNGDWSLPRHLPICVANVIERMPGTVSPAPAPGPLPAPFVSYIPSDRLCRTAFEWERTPEYPAKHAGDVRIRRAAWWLRVSDDAATGKGCVEQVNLAEKWFNSGYLRKREWDVERWPKVAFDYKFGQPGCALNLSLLVNEAMAIVEWTGANPKTHYFAPHVVGSAETAKQDGQWHHVEFDLLDMLVRSRFRDPSIRARLTASELATWATSHTGRGYRNPGGARLKIDNVTIFSDRGRSPGFEWRMPPGSADVKGYAYVLDQSPDTQPAQALKTRDTRVSFESVASGVWHFHVCAQSTDGRWGAVAHRRFVVK